MGSGYIVQRGGGKDYSVFQALADRSITEVTAEMLDGASEIGKYAFYYCTSLTSIDIPNSVTRIMENAFYNCTSLSSVTIPSSVTSIGDSVFSNCTSLISITIPSSVTSLGIYVFSNCTRITSITIPSSVTSIGYGVFSNCSALTSVTVEATTPPTLGNNVFLNTSGNLVIYVPSESVGTYKSASRWSTYADRIQAIPST